MVTRRSAKVKGSQFEMDCEYSLKKKFPDVRRLGGEGQFREVDLESKSTQMVFECKRHRGFRWTELKKYYDKLENRTPFGWYCYLLFKGNLQPCLVMYKDKEEMIVREFEHFFGVPFEKHITKKVKRK